MARAIQTVQEGAREPLCAALSPSLIPSSGDPPLRPRGTQIASLKNAESLDGLAQVVSHHQNKSTPTNLTQSAGWSITLICGSEAWRFSWETPRKKAGRHPTFGGEVAVVAVAGEEWHRVPLWGIQPSTNPIVRRPLPLAQRSTICQPEKCR